MTASETHVLVIGAGPGGYAAAIRCGQLGLATTIVENTRLGGTCLIRGCIPSKALIHAADEFATVTRHSHDSPYGIQTSPPTIDFASTKHWKDGIVDQLSNGVGGLLRAAGVRTIEGTARLTDGKTALVSTAAGEERISAEHIIVAAGSAPVELPFLPFSPVTPVSPVSPVSPADSGPFVVSSAGALNLTEVPNELVIVGAGYIGLELGTAFAKLGSHVTFVETADRILPSYDAELTAPVASKLTELGATFHFGARATGVVDGRALAAIGADGAELEIAADRILVTVGRSPRVDGWGRANLVIDMDGPFVKVDAQCRTSMRNVYAIGDLVGEPMLAHRATAQGEMVAEIIAGHRREFAPTAIPAVVFTDPEIVVVGLTVAEAETEGYDVTVGTFPLAANGRTLSLDGDRSGFVRLVAETTTGLVLGTQAVGTGVAELQGTLVTMIEMASTLDDAAGIIQAHPSLGEAITESALVAQGRPLHIPMRNQRK